jgi:hypothetical protein
LLLLLFLGLVIFLAVLAAAILREADGKDNGMQMMS